jgi:hypothetical protein
MAVMVRTAVAIIAPAPITSIAAVSSSAARGILHARAEIAADSSFVGRLLRGVGGKNRVGLRIG